LSSLLLTMSSSKNSLPNAEATGNLLAEFRTGSLSHKAILIGGWLPAAFFFGLWLAVFAKLGAGIFANGGSIAATVVFLGLGGLILAAWLVALAALRWSLLLFEKGLLFCKGSSSRWMPWQDIAKYKEITVILNGVSTGHRLYLHPKHGKTIRVDGIFKNAPAVVDSIKARLIPALIHQAEERLARKEAVDFQFLKLSQDGLQSRTEFLAWKDLASVAVEDNKGLYFQVVVRVPGKKNPWLSIPCTAFPNLDVFLTLLDKMKT
jgi:hypothetical protein